MPDFTWNIFNTFYGIFMEKIIKIWKFLSSKLSKLLGLTKYTNKNKVKFMITKSMVKTLKNIFEI